MRVLAAALRRDVRDRALDDFQQCLLHALAGDVTRDGGVLALAGDLVDLVDIDDAALGELHVVIRRLKQAEQNVFHIVADVARLGEGRRVRDGERHLQNAGERLGKERLAAASRAEEQDVALLQLHLVVAAEEDAFIVVVDGHGQRNLGRLLPDDILVEHLANFAWGWSRALPARRAAHSRPPARPCTGGRTHRRCARQAPGSCGALRARSCRRTSSEALFSYLHS